MTSGRMVLRPAPSFWPGNLAGLWCYELLERFK
jgi:hypothetical protein